MKPAITFFLMLLFIIDPSFECGYHLPQSLNMLTESFSLPIVDKCIGIEYINNGLTFYQSQQCVKTIDKDQHNIKPEMNCKKSLNRFPSLLAILMVHFPAILRSANKTVQLCLDTTLL